MKSKREFKTSYLEGEKIRNTQRHHPNEMPQPIETPMPNGGKLKRLAAILWFEIGKLLNC